MITAIVLGLYWLSTFIKSTLSFTLPTNISTTINQVSDFPKIAVLEVSFSTELSPSLSSDENPCFLLSTLYQGQCGRWENNGG